MSAIVTNAARHALDHFEPEVDLDPAAQRKLRGHLEQIDYTAYASNRAVVGKGMARTHLDKFKHLAVAAAHARTRWVEAATTMAEKNPQLSPDQVSQLAALRRAFEELTEAYEAMRRMVERGYLAFHASTS